MVALVLAATAFALAACSESPEPFPAIAETANSSIPDVSLELIACTPSQSFVACRVRATNHSGATVWFIGYEHQPFHRLELLVDGQWTDRTPLGCGTGMSRQPLASGASIEWNVWAEEPLATRVGVEFSTAQERNESGSVVWVAYSDAFQSPSFPQPER